MKVLYTAEATATGGRDGQVKSDNGVLNLQVRLPKAMGGANDNYTNPEQLFAAGYAACFDSALNHTIRLEKVKTGTTSVTAKVSIGPFDGGAFGLAVELAVNISGVPLEEAQRLTERAHQACPYSNATRNNIEVKLTTTNN
ncbi:organic hydroperoxide resistance protein [Mucilaginibacter sp. UR6-1]|uniref:organic hydroperoxide resistance protein n=1 Tax=Mucilaginibacter sp. UR6-1 TaxID=1435643 RepID=UPI001E28EECD|nr:organic hydroperoxide resistance protein [Mucilaginibacter sp. UR6-1]MCC8408608.1 organic hydroperoxide resistance protein [Mucilaginibacter sp. UR6-1]